MSIPLSFALAFYVYYNHQCYAAICYHPTQDPQVAPVQMIAMLVFYSSVALTLLVLSAFRKFEYVREFMRSRVLQNLCLGELMVLVLILCLFIFQFSAHFIAVMQNEQSWSLSGLMTRLQIYDATIITGRIVELNMGLVMLAAGKDSIQALAGVPFSTTLPYHRVLGWIFIWISFIHTVLYLWTLALDPQESFGSHMVYLLTVIKAQSMGFVSFYSCFCFDLQGTF